MTTLSGRPVPHDVVAGVVDGHEQKVDVGMMALIARAPAVGGG